MMKIPLGRSIQPINHYRIFPAKCDNSQLISQVRFNVPLDTRVISETSLTRQSAALILTVNQQQPRDNTHKKPSQKRTGGQTY